MDTSFLQSSAHLLWLPALDHRGVTENSSVEANKTQSNTTEENEFYSYDNNKNMNSASRIKKSELLKYIKELCDLISSKYCCLHPQCYYQLVLIGADKIVIMILYYLMLLQKHGRTLQMSGMDTLQIYRDIKQIKWDFLQIISHEETVQYTDAIVERFRYLDQILVLITKPKTSGDYREALNSILKVAKGNPANALAMERFARCGVDLRHDSINPHAAGKAFTISIPNLLSLNQKSTNDINHDKGNSSNQILTDETALLLDAIRGCHEERTSEEHLDFNNLNPIEKLYFYKEESSLEDLLFIPSSRLVQYIEEKKNKQFSTIISNFFTGIQKNRYHPDNLNNLSAHGKFGSSYVTRTSAAINSHKVIVSNIHIYDLVCLSGKPKAFLVLGMNDNSLNQKTSVAAEGLSPSWEREKFEFELSTLSDAFLICTLMYEGHVYGVTTVATLRISLSSLDLLNIENEQYIFDCNYSPKIKAAVETAALHGRGVPRVTLTVTLKNC